MSTSKQRDRKCATCRHYQPSPLWRKGWCRNPLLFDQNTNHLVEADSLACQRAFIDYWEARAPRDTPAMGPTARTADAPLTRPRVAPSIPLVPTGPGGQPLRATRAATAEALTPREKPPLTLVRPGEGTGGPGSDAGAPTAAPGPPEGGDVTQPLPVVDTDPAQAAPTTAIRIQGVTPPPPEPAAISRGRVRGILAAGVGLGLLLLLVVWVPRLNPALSFPGFGARTPVPTAEPTQVALLLPPSATATPEPPAIAPAPTPPPPPPPPQLAVGGTAQVTNTDGAPLRIRQTPSLQGRILARVPEGARLQLKSGPREVGSGKWWEVTGFDTKGTSGWCIDTYLVAVP
jgi:hypothetical protein